MLNVLSFGGCTVTNPLLNLSKRKIAAPVYRRMGFKRSPYALSPRAIMQLWAFCKGELDIPARVRRLVYADAETTPDGSSSHLLTEVDCVLVEISTPYELLLDGFVLNHNRVLEQLRLCLPDTKRSVKVASRWRSAVIAEKYDERDAIAELLRPHLTDDPFLRDMATHMLWNMTSTRTGSDGMADVFSHLRQCSTAPIGIVLHNFHYMPDGRAIIFPPDLNEQIGRIAESENMPVYDPARLVRQHGVEAALMSDFRHWNASFYPVVADGMHAFMQNELLVEGVRDKAA